MLDTRSLEKELPAPVRVARDLGAGLAARTLTTIVPCPVAPACQGEAVQAVPSPANATGAAPWPADVERLVLSPTDLTKHLACAHLTTLDLMAARRQLDPPDQVDETLELIFRLGLDHERAYLERLRLQGRSIVEVAQAPIEEMVEQTQLALSSGADVIYQASFQHDGNRGHADFLLRSDRPSRLGDYSYDVADTKLARRLKVAALLQMADYGRHLERLQGVPPQWLTVVSGDAVEHRVRYADVAAYARRATSSLRYAIEHPPQTVAEPVSHCGQCRWSARCEAEWRQADHLSLVAFMRGDHRRALEDAGITTVSSLAATDPGSLPSTLGRSTRERLHAQAVLQVQERRTGRPAYELLPAAPGLGLLRLPAPDPSDLYLDFEGDPYAEGGDGREYLAGLWDRDGSFTTFWAHSADQERDLTAQLLELLVSRLDAFPGMHVYHYAPYERSALARLTQRHGVGERELDRLLRGERLVDLYGVVRQGLRISKGSYSLKKLEAFYWGGIRGAGDQPDDVADALASVVAYERWLESGDSSVLAGIAAYNRDDVRSTHDLHGWLEDRRIELEMTLGPQPRPSPPDGQPSQSVTEREDRERAVGDDLRQAGHVVLADLLGWHRREDKPQWWDFYRLGDLTDDELVRDPAALGELGPPEHVRSLPPPRRSTLWRYRFPVQDSKLSGRVADVDTHAGLGEVEALDATEGWVELAFANGREPPSPRGLGPTGPVMSLAQQDSLLRTASAVLGGDDPLGQQLLDRVVPDGLAALPGELPRDVVLRVGRAMRRGVLAVQGPPGSGKTTVGAELIRALLDDGCTVGVTAQSHAVIGHLLEATGRPALQKCTPEQHCGAAGIEQTGSNDDVERALAGGRHRLVAGTSWLWSRPELAGSADVLVIDEAGQFSLADAFAVAQAARTLVLLGDPQQLASPSQGVHPPGAGASAFEHLLDGAATLPADRGVFLDRTWRLHPDLARVVSRLMYDDRLEAAPGRERQHVLAPEPLGGTGVRWIPVEHVGNESASSEEVLVVAKAVAELVGSQWVDAAGQARPFELSDVLVVTPYNAQVALLRAALPPAARIGTVDKFQGQEAAVVIYSMASSSVEDAPRGVSFLYDLHRLNVAISRARCVAVMVGAPALLDAAVRTPEQLRAVNGFLTVVDAATTP